METKILFVCTGNTCRSPIAESVLREKLKKQKVYKAFKVDSAGIFADKNSQINPLVSKVLKSNNIRPVRHRPRKFTKAMMNKYDIIITMTAEHKMYILQEYSKSLNKNVLTMAEITGDRIPDPYDGDYFVYKNTADLIINSIEKIYKRLKDGNK